MNLEKAVVSASSAHITLCVFYLKNDKEVQSAVSILRLYQPHIQDIVGEPNLHLHIKGIGNFKNQVVFAEILQDKSYEKLRLLAGLLSEKISEVTGEENRKQDFKAHITIMKLSKLRKNQIRKLPTPLYYSMRNMTFGHEKATEIQLLSMLKPKHINGYYACEGHIHFKNCTLAETTSLAHVDFSLPDWAESLSIACITRALFYVRCEEASTNSVLDGSADVHRPNKKIKLTLDPG